MIVLWNKRAMHYVGLVVGLAVIASGTVAAPHRVLRYMIVT